MRRDTNGLHETSKPKNMLTNHTLFIDKNCPRCHVYGELFQRFRLTDPTVISYFQEITAEQKNKIDYERAKSEIALIDQEKGEVTYGADSFLKILFHRIPWFITFLHFPPIYWLIQKVYCFVSFNRKVMAPPPNSGIACDCVPRFHWGYRIAYLLVVALITGVILNKFSTVLLTHFEMDAPFWQEYVICFGQILWQGALLLWWSKEKTMDYLGNMSTVSLVGGFGVYLVLGINAFIPIGIYGLLLGFGLVVSGMLWMHIRRSKSLGLPLLISLSWVFYRMTVLFILIGINV